MQLKLWKQVNLSLLLPVLAASSITLYAVYNLGTISNRINFIEIADDMNLTLLELRRYEKNILLFKEEENTAKFYGFLTQLEAKIRSAERQIVEETNRQSYRPLIKEIDAYKEAAGSLVSSVIKEQRLLDEIRPLGRRIEKDASRKEKALELRRHEKNYIIYREQSAVKKLHLLAEELTRTQPDLKLPVTHYMTVFDSLTQNELLKDRLILRMRETGRAIEKITMEFADKKRGAIDKTISASRILLLASFIFIIASTCIVACLFSMNLVRTLKIMENSFARLKAGDFTRGIDLKAGHVPVEIMSFVETYNQTINDLGTSQAELENTLKKIEETNRELIERQDELVNAKKLSAMRLLASEIAHEINNPLSTLTTFLGMFYEDIPADDPRRETFALMVKEAARCRTILLELADFAKKEPLKLKATDPVELVRGAIEIVGEQNRHSGIALTSTINSLPPKVVLDPTLMYQALVNVLSNAYQFTQPGGHIDVRADAEGEFLKIVIRDTGAGITEENLANIFDPFFSTRKDCGGSGLGLAITKKIIERHNGSIGVQSKLGEGTMFSITLPLNNGSI